MLRVASVAFVNAKPLVEGLEKACELSFDVPSGLLARLEDGRAEVALLPTIDLQRMPNLCVIPGSGIGCDGPTLTVRLYARRPFDQITHVAADTDSHTSVALSKIVFAHIFKTTPGYAPLHDRTGRDDEALLLIGDKVVTDEPADYPIQLDLGEAWKQLTGRPFVFAAWATRVGTKLGDLPTQLNAARQRGLSKVDAIVAEHAVPRGWPADIARQYMTDYLRYAVGRSELDAIIEFHRLAHEVGAIDHEPWPLRLYGE